VFALTLDTFSFSGRS